MKVTINGVSYEAPDGASIGVIDGKVIINGDPLAAISSPVVRVVIEGNTGPILAKNASVEVKGSVAGMIDAGGSVTCGSVTGSVDAGGSVSCGDVGGDVDAGGSVRCGSVRGGVDAGGSVRHG